MRWRSFLRTTWIAETVQNKFTRLSFECQHFERLLYLSDFGFPWYFNFPESNNWYEMTRNPCLVSLCPYLELHPEESNERMSTPEDTGLTTLLAHFVHTNDGPAEFIIGYGLMCVCVCVCVNRIRSLILPLCCPLETQ